MNTRGEGGQRGAEAAKTPEHAESRRLYGMALMALGLATASADHLRAMLPDLSTSSSAPKRVEISREEADELRHRAETLGRLFETMRDLAEEREAEPISRAKTFDGVKFDSEFLGEKSPTLDPMTNRFFETQEFVPEALLGIQENMEIEVDGDYLGLHAENVSVTSPLEDAFPEGFSVSIDLSYQIETSDAEGILTLVRTDNGYGKTDVLISTDQTDGFTNDEIREAVRTDFQRQVVVHAVEAELSWETEMNNPAEE